MRDPLHLGPGLRVLSTAATLATYAMVVVTTIVVIIGALVLSGRGSVSVNSSLKPPYTIELHDDRALTVGTDGTWTTYTNFDIGDESKYFDGAPTVHAPVHVDRADKDTRIIGVAGVGVFLALGWAGLVQFRRITESARNGDPFDPRNVRRFRWLAVIVLFTRLVTEIGERIMTRTLDVDVAVEVTLTSAGWLPVLGAALGLLALSEVFRTGTELRQFEQETV